MISIKRKQWLALLRTAAWIALAISGAGAGGSQDSSVAVPGSAQRLPPPGLPVDESLGSIQQKALRDQLVKRNTIRQQQLVADTNKLLKLATELKEEVDKSNKDTLSIVVVKKSEEIEKLAKSVKDKMKNPM